MSAFTLLELVIVLAVIVVALAVIAPVLSRAKSAARRAVCISNLHQNGLAMFTYLNDNSQKFPPFFFDIKVKNNNPKLQVSVKKKSKKDAGVTVFSVSDLTCPEDTDPDVLEVEPSNANNDEAGKGNNKNDDEPSSDGKPSIYMRVSYGYNIAYIVSDSTFDLIAKPAEHITLYDGSMSSDTPKKMAMKDIAGNYNNSLEFAKFAMTPRHLGSANATFADAHVAGFTMLTDDNITVDNAFSALFDAPFTAMFN